MKKTNLYRPCSIGMLIALAAVASFQSLATPRESPYSWKQSISGSELKVSVSISRKHYLYSDKTEVSVKVPEKGDLQALSVPEPEAYTDEFGTKMKIYPAGRHHWTFPADPGSAFNINLKSS